MSHHNRPLFTAPLSGLEASDSSGEAISGASGVEDSLRGTTIAFDGAVANHVFGRPPHNPGGNTSYAFAATPDSAVPPLPPQLQAAWQQQQPPRPSASMEQTPQAGPSTYAVPPRIERQPPPRAQVHTMAPLFASMAGHGLFTRPMPAGMPAFGSPTEMSMSNSFSFAPRGGGGGSGSAGTMFALPTARNPNSPPALPALVAPHTPVRRAQPTTATTTAAAPMFFHPIAMPAQPTNLDAAALAAERRIREARDAHSTRRSVSFSPTVTTPQNLAMAMPYSAVPPPPPQPPAGPLHRAAAGAVVDASISHLGRNPRVPTMRSARDPSLSLSTETSATFARPTATRLFAATTGSQQTSMFASPRTTHVSTGSEPEPEAQASWTQDASTSLSASQHSSAQPAPAQVAAPVRLRKWDGSSTLVPAYIVSDTPESAIEELFDSAVLQFDVASVAARSSAVGQGAGLQNERGKEEVVVEEDVVLAILQVQLGLKGLHGWYGHRYRNPRCVRGEVKSRKRRRTISPSSVASATSPVSGNNSIEEKQDEEAEEEEAEEEEGQPIVVYDSFGRVRGSVVLPNYARRGGPSLPLPPPNETYALRHAASSRRVLNHLKTLSSQEQSLLQQQSTLQTQWRELQAPSTHTPPATAAAAVGASTTTIRSAQFYKQLKAKRCKLARFHADHRAGLLKGLQNAYLDSAAVAPRSRT